MSLEECNDTGSTSGDEDAPPTGLRRETIPVSEAAADEAVLRRLAA